MRDIDFKVLKFLVEGKAYSDTAVMKNLGISFEELQKSYEILTQEGYLESYTDYLARKTFVFVMFKQYSRRRL